MINWFYDLGGYLKSLEASQQIGWQVIEGFTTITEARSFKQFREASYAPGNGTSYYSAGIDRRKLIDITRYLWREPPVVRAPSINRHPFKRNGWQKAITIAELLLLTLI